jgi:hypothetical protein
MLALVCAFALLPSLVIAAAPTTLDCTSDESLNWRVEAPQLASMDDGGDRIGDAPIVHLDPASGEWHLEVPGARALTVGGGTFEIVRGADFAAYHQEWVGVDHDTMLRIWGGGETDLRFLFVSDGYGVVLGTCTEPDEPFLFLREPG